MIFNQMMINNKASVNAQWKVLLMNNERYFTCIDSLGEATASRLTLNQSYSFNRLKSIPLNRDLLVFDTLFYIHQWNNFMRSVFFFIQTIDKVNKYRTQSEGFIIVYRIEVWTVCQLSSSFVFNRFDKIVYKLSNFMIHGY